MAFAGGGLNRPSSRDSAPGPRFFFFAVLSIVLMYFDQRDGWSERIRYALQAAAYPVQVAVGSPGKLWTATRDLFQTRDSLRTENAALRQRAQVLSLEAMRQAALETENARLRGLNAALPPLVSRHELADVVSDDLGNSRQRLVVNRGARGGAYRSQAVVDGTGLMGQLFRVGPWSAEVMLITDPEHAVPVQVVRNGFRSIAVGSGAGDELSLSVPVNSDIKAGDLLVTSGLGGVFPAGVPVGVVTSNVRDPDQILAQVKARPSARLANDRQVMLLWFDMKNPAAPVEPRLIEQLPEAVVGQPVLTPPALTPPAGAKP
ncbi:MAG: rod shape-determining protein MreC [Pseudomonadota bacterium]